MYEYKDTYEDDAKQLFEKLIYINGLEHGIMRNLEDEIEYGNLGDHVRDYKSTNR